MSFTRNNADDNRDSFSHYYVKNVEIKDFNILIDGNSFFDLPVKNEEETYKKVIEMIMTTQLLVLISKKNYRLIEIDFSKKTKLKDLQQSIFIGKREHLDHGATMFFIIGKSEETTFNFSQNSVTVI